MSLRGHSRQAVGFSSSETTDESHPPVRSALAHTEHKCAWRSRHLYRTMQSSLRDTAGLTRRATAALDPESGRRSRLDRQPQWTFAMTELARPSTKAIEKRMWKAVFIGLSRCGEPAPEPR